MTGHVGFAQKGHPEKSRTLVDRRSLMKTTAAMGAAVLGRSVVAKAAAATTSFDITQAPFNADQSGQQDCSAAVQAALDAISANGSGRLIVPAGTYKLLSPLTCTGSLTLIGDGQASSVFVVLHTSAALTVNCASWAGSVTIRDVGFSPCPGNGGAAGTALSLNFPAVNSGWQRCSLQDVDLGVAKPNYTTFMTGISLSNVWRGSFRNVNMHSNIGGVPGSTFVTLSGKSVDNRFASCSVDGIDIGFFVADYSEGLHITESLVIGTTAISTGSRVYSGNGSSTPCINLLGLYVSDCEFNCWGVTANLYCVATAWISNTHFGSNVAGAPAMAVLGCSTIQIDNCSFTGQFGGANSGYDIGISTGLAGSWPSNNIAISNCVFTTIAVGVQFNPGTYNSTAIGLRMMMPGEGALVNYPGAAGTVPLRAFYDLSANSTNMGQWYASVSGLTAPPSKVRYSFPAAP